MKLSMWIINDWLEKYDPEVHIFEGRQTISGVRYISDGMDLSTDYLYIGYTDQFIDRTPHNIICVNSTDSIELTAPDIYIIFNEIQQMMEFYNNWETGILHAISNDKALEDILKMTTPIFKTSVAMTDISHKVLAEAEYMEKHKRYELANGYFSLDEMSFINRQLQEHISEKTPFVIRSLNSSDIIRNFYSKTGRLTGWFVSLEGGAAYHLISRQQLIESFCSLMDLWFKIHVESLDESSLFLDVLELTETDPETINFRMAGLGWNDEPEMQLILFKSTVSSDMGISFINRILEKNYSGISAFRFRENFIIVVNYSLLNKNEFFAELKQLMGQQSALCGVSYPFHCPDSLMQNYLQARFAAEAGSEIPGSVNYFADHALEYMQSRFRSSLDFDMTSPDLEILRQYDLVNGTEYYMTLQTYLKCERNQTLAAKKLCIHRNSLVYRIGRIESLISADLDDERQRLYLLLSFIARE